MPNAANLTPEYEQTAFDPTEKRGKLRLVASPNGAEGSVTIHSDALLFAGLFNPKENATHTLSKNRMAYVHVARGNITINGEPLEAGDALMLRDEAAVKISDGKNAEILLFDLPKD
jgi:redox-sensitive bicupin YhaK (pirin superfamily)